MKFAGKFTRKRLVMCLLAGSVVTSLLGSRVSGRLRGPVWTALGPLADMPMYLTTAFKAHVGGPAGISPDQAARLLEENRLLEGQLLELSRAYQQRLRQDAMMQYLYGRMTDFPCELVAARVVAAGALPYGQTRVVNAGRSSGVAAGASVTTRTLLTDRSKALPLPPARATISGTTLVGRIVDAGAFTARLQLVSDRGFEIEAQIRRSINPRSPREITVTRRDTAALETLTPDNNFLIPAPFVQGDGRGSLIVSNVSSNHNVLPGDWLITRRDDLFLPAGIRIGEVTKVAEDPKHPGFVMLTVRPHADMEALREVYVVIPLDVPSRRAAPRGGR